MPEKSKPVTPMGALGAGIDRLVEAWSPNRAVRRAQSRLKLQVVNTAFRGASRRRGMETFNVRGGSADADLLPEQATLRNRSRDLVRNAPIAAGAIESISSNAIRHGMIPRSTIDHELAGISEDRARGLEKQINRGFNLWKRHADVGGRFGFGGSQDLLLRSMLTNGDALVVRRAKVRMQSPYLLAVDIIEGDRVSTPRSGFDLTGLDVRNGVELDGDGAAVAHYVQRTHPGATRATGGARTFKQEWDRIPAYDATGRWQSRLIYPMKRPGQTRGVPFFAPVIELFQQLNDYMDAELIAARVAACFSAFITSESGGYENAEGNADGTTSGGDPLETLMPGIIQYLEEGESVDFGNPNRPNGSFEIFIKSVLTFIGAGLGIPVQVLTNNFEGMNYSQMRGAIVQATYVFTQMQDFLIEQYCQPMWEELIREMVDQGDVQLPRFASVPDAYFGVSWVRPRREAIDQLKQAQADAVEVALETETRTAILAGKGRTVEDHTAELAGERALFEAATGGTGDGTTDPAEITKRSGGGKQNGRTTPTPAAAAAGSAKGN